MQQCDCIAGVDLDITCVNGYSYCSCSYLSQLDGDEILLKQLLQRKADYDELKQFKAHNKIVMNKFNQRTILIEKQQVWSNNDIKKLLFAVATYGQYKYKKVQKVLGPDQNGNLRTRRACFEKYGQIVDVLWSKTEGGMCYSFTNSVIVWACKASCEIIDENFIKQSGKTAKQIEEVLTAMQMKFTKANGQLVNFTAKKQ
ncbi:SANT/Myb_domain [Hexamita inflata]|uniref:SANT/Myb domain n=1 Tax=Hexamita inflata TaxID=28002 RepID=A0AA86TIM9_9EUKA|nr:SANT/Myb domain [Hexamita inflata]CAI9918401.1 SANT/Myb domain [Hexamita inflata]